MPYKMRQFRCADCGKPVSRRRPAGAVVRCPLCAIAYSAEEQRQLAAHAGPHWDRYVWAYGLAVRRMRSSPAPGESQSLAS
jgi:hypothetical protein